MTSSVKLDGQKHQTLGTKKMEQEMELKAIKMDEHANRSKNKSKGNGEEGE